MFKRFSEGLVFGAGFAVSFITLLFLAVFLISPMILSRQFEHASAIQQSDIETYPHFSAAESSITFHELGIEEQIKKSSVIALAKFEPDPDGRMKAVIKEFLKKEAGAIINYKVGDEHPSSSYYPKDNIGHGDGVVMFFTGSPATMKMSMTYTGDRIHSLGDLPVELFRKKCSESDAKPQ